MSTALFDEAQSQSPRVAARTWEEETLRRHLVAVLKGEVIQPFGVPTIREEHETHAVMNCQRWAL